VISSVFRAKLKLVSVMSRGKCLAHLVLVEHGADLKADFSFAAQRLALAGDGGGDAGKVALGGSEQILALAGALVGLQPTGGPGWSQPSPASHRRRRDPCNARAGRIQAMAGLAVQQYGFRGLKVDGVEARRPGRFAPALSPSPEESSLEFPPVRSRKRRRRVVRTRSSPITTT
jgi:hypothetical protein